MAIGLDLDSSGERKFPWRVNVIDLIEVLHCYIKKKQPYNNLLLSTIFKIGLSTPENKGRVKQMNLYELQKKSHHIL